MSIVDVLKSVEELAKAVARRARELDELKEQYARKLQTLNLYIEQFPVEAETIDDEELIANIERSRQCPHCRKDVDFGDFGMVLVPKSLIRGPGVKNVEANKDEPNEVESKNVFAKDGEKLVQLTAGLSIQRPPHEEHKHHAKQRLKKTCSYCNKPGHSRARCWTRLNGQKPTDAET